MYLGQLVEKADSKELFMNPLHPYTKALLSAIPVPSLKYKRERFLLKGEITSPINQNQDVDLHKDVFMQRQLSC